MPVAQKANSRKIIIKPLHIKKASPLYFPTIITEFSDSWTPRWTATNVYGRMDPVSFYNGTSRETTLGFRVISDSEAEAKENMDNIQKLLQYQYPTYRSTGGIRILKAPPYFNFKVMNFVGGGTNLQGYINGAIQINPGFQTKDQAQYFSANYDKIYFSDINVVLRIQVLHQKFIGYRGKKFGNGEKYPYDVAQKPAENAAGTPHKLNNAVTSQETTPAAMNTEDMSVTTRQKIKQNQEQLYELKLRRRPSSILKSSDEFIS